MIVTRHEASVQLLGATIEHYFRVLVDSIWRPILGGRSGMIDPKG
jgi:hypothetical protein